MFVGETFNLRYAWTDEATLPQTVTEPFSVTFEYTCDSNSMVSSGPIADITYTILAPGTTPVPTSVTSPLVTVDSGCTVTTMLQIDTTGSGVWEDYEGTSFM